MTRILDAQGRVASAAKKKPQILNAQGKPASDSPVILGADGNELSSAPAKPVILDADGRDITAAPAKPAILDAQGQDASAKPVLLDPQGRPINGEVRNYGFPKNFVFGASTSAYQIEGGWNAHGKGMSIWDVFSSVPGNMANGDSGDIACDHYHLWKQDVALMRRLGLDAYRFSIAWSRVIPDGRGAVNERGLDFYERLVDELLEQGIQPFATLYHWDLPQGMHELGGWFNRDMSHYFAEYAGLIGRRLGDRLASIATFNELQVIVDGYTGGMAPGYGSPTMKWQAGHNLLLAHGRGMLALRTVCPKTPAGIVLNFNQIDPTSDKPEAAQAAELEWTRAYGWYLDALMNGKYPDDVLNHVRRGKLSIRAEDMKLISQKMDFIGVNYYTRFTVDENGRWVDLPDLPRTLTGWEITPQSFTKMMVRMKNEWSNLPPIYITENGAALRDELTDGHVKDDGRIAYLDSHIAALAEAVKQGVDIRGYFVWSLLDNLEWSGGFGLPFGITHVDFKTRVRTPKHSAWWYAAAIAAQKQSR